jgi:predicted nucleic acid-binding protein
MIEICKRFIRWLTIQRHSIMVPAPVVAEYFAGATATELHEQGLLMRGFEIPVLDARSAVLAAELQRGGVVDALHDEYGVPRQHLRIDAMIIAIAIAKEAHIIITHNVNEFRTLARGRIDVQPVPVILEERSLFPLDEP